MKLALSKEASIFDFSLYLVVVNEYERGIKADFEELMPPA
jgi:hypothetical protein